MNKQKLLTVTTQLNNLNAKLFCLRLQDRLFPKHLSYEREKTKSKKGK